VRWETTDECLTTPFPNVVVSPSPYPTLVSRRCRACFRPTDRSVKDVEAITSRLRRVDTLNRLPNSVLQQLAFVGYYEDLERGVMRKSENQRAPASTNIIATGFGRNTAPTIV